MQTTHAHYHSYLLRIWRTDGATASWQASLQAATTSRPSGFACLEELFVYLVNTVEASGVNAIEGEPDDSEVETKNEFS